MRSRFLFVLLILLIGTGVLSQNINAVSLPGLDGLKMKVRLYGRITDARTGEPLPGASIYFTDQKIGTAADSNGHYSITNIPDGHHVVEVSHSGYGTIVEHIEILADLEKNYAVPPVLHLH